MNDVRKLSKKDLVEIIRRIRDWLWLREDAEFDVRTIFGQALAKKLRKEQPNKQFLEFYDPDRAWDADIFDGVADVFRDYKLEPKKLLPLSAGYPEKGRKRCTKS